MSDLVGFIGVAEPRGTVLRLVAQGNNGYLELSAQDVKMEEGRILVRKGAVALAIEEPRAGDVKDRPSTEALRVLCPSGVTCCIGSVHVCCDNFRVIGSCTGAWGCGRSTFVP